MKMNSIKWVKDLRSLTVAILSLVGLYIIRFYGILICKTTRILESGSHDKTFDDDWVADSPSFSGIKKMSNLPMVKDL